MTFDNADGTKVELVATDKLLEWIKENGEPIGVTTYEQYKEFMNKNGVDDDEIRTELITYMIDDGLVKWKYMKHDFTDEIYTFLVKTEHLDLWPFNGM